MQNRRQVEERDRKGNSSDKWNGDRVSSRRTKARVKTAWATVFIVRASVNEDIVSQQTVHAAAESTANKGNESLAASHRILAATQSAGVWLRSCQPWRRAASKRALVETCAERSRWTTMQRAPIAPHAPRQDFRTRLLDAVGLI